jgi:hypothetical protein
MNMPFLKRLSAGCLLALALALPAGAQDDANTPSLISSAPETVSMGKTIVTSLLAPPDVEIQDGQLLLYLNGRPLHGLTAYRTGSTRDTSVIGADGAPKSMRIMSYAFLLERTDSSRRTWGALIGSPRSSLRRFQVGVGTADAGEFPVSAAEPPEVQFRVVRAGWFMLGLMVLIVVIIGFCLAGWKTRLLRDPGGDNPPYSLAKTIAAIWGTIILGAFLLIWLATGEFNGIVTGDAVLLAGITLATAATSLTISRDVSALRAADAHVPKHRGWLTDMMWNQSGPALHRFQTLVWNAVMMAIFCTVAYESLIMPELDTELLALLGISNGMYLGVKLNEEPKR